MGLCLFFLPNFPGATSIQGDTFIPDSRVQGSQEDYAFPENAFLYIAFLGSAFSGTSLLL